MAAPALLLDRNDKFVNKQTDQQKKVKPQKQKADPDKRRYLYARFGISFVYFPDLRDQALKNADEQFHAGISLTKTTSGKSC
jgi:hypothetical protein